MNERIRELAKSVQCERHWTEEDIEKFAKLIVQDCAGLCYEIHEYGEYPESEAEACAEYILKHFGIKE